MFASTKTRWGIAEDYRRLAGAGIPTPASQYSLSVGEEPFLLLIQTAQLFESRTASSRVSLAQVQHFVPIETRMRPLFEGADSAFGHPLHQSRSRNAEQVCCHCAGQLRWQLPNRNRTLLCNQLQSIQ